MPFNLGGQTYKTKADVLENCRRIFNSLSDGEEVKEGPDFSFLADLFTWHPSVSTKLCDGTLSAIKKGIHYGAYTSRAFYIRSCDSDWIDISFHVALGQYSSQEAIRRRFKPALRLLIRDQIDAFRGDACPKTYHVDHTGEREFRHLVRDFIDEYKVDIDSLEWYTLPYKNEVHMFNDEELQQQWKQYHQQHAQLQLITKQQNLRKRKRQT